MKIIPLRRLRNQPGEVREALENDDLMLTSNGEPLGLLLRAPEEGWEDLLAAVRQARSLAALSRLRQQARKSGADRLGTAAIAREIQASRRARGVSGRRR